MSSLLSIDIRRDPPPLSDVERGLSDAQESIVKSKDQLQLIVVITGFVFLSLLLVLWNAGLLGTVDAFFFFAFPIILGGGGGFVYAAFRVFFYDEDPNHIRFADLLPVISIGIVSSAIVVGWPSGWLMLCAVLWGVVLYRLLEVSQRWSLDRTAVATYSPADASRYERINHLCCKHPELEVYRQKMVSQGPSRSLTTAEADSFELWPQTQCRLQEEEEDRQQCQQFHDPSPQPPSK